MQAIREGKYKSSYFPFFFIIPRYTVYIKYLLPDEAGDILSYPAMRKFRQCTIYNCSFSPPSLKSNFETDDMGQKLAQEMSPPFSYFHLKSWIAMTTRVHLNLKALPHKYIYLKEFPGRMLKIMQNSIFLLYNIFVQGLDFNQKGLIKGSQ